MFADVTITPEAMAAISTIIGGMATAIVALAWVCRILYYKNVENYERMIVWKQMQGEAVVVAEIAANKERQRKGEEPFVPVLPQLPEKTSAPTKSQVDLADQQTMKARTVAAAINVGVPAPLLESLRPGDLMPK